MGFRVLTGQGAQIDTITAADKLIFRIFAALADYAKSAKMQSQAFRSAPIAG
jgi:hypothetical protein